MLAAGDAALMLLARQWPGGMSALPPRNGVAPTKNGTVYDESQRVGRITGVCRPVVTMPLTTVLTLGSAPAALIVFAVEYEWARRHLVTVRDRARSAADKAAASRVATASAVLFGIGAIGLGAVLIFTDLLPLSGVWTGASVALGGLTVLATTAYSVREMRRAQRAERAWGEASDRA